VPGLHKLSTLWSRNHALHLSGLSHDEYVLLILDYLTNVLEDLGLSPTDQLMEVLKLLKASPADFETLSEGGTPSVVAAIQAMRNIDIQ